MGIGLSDLLPDSVREQILALITPSQEEIDRQARVINQLREALKEKVESTEYQYSFIEPEGSTGRKQTPRLLPANNCLKLPHDFPCIGIP